MGNAPVPQPPTRCVLVVEAHEDTRQLHAEYLRAAGFTVWTSWRVDEATGLAVHADAVVTGLCIERWMDGLEFIARVRADQKRVRRLPIIVVTAHAQEATRELAAAAGADMVFAKPCPLEMLAAAVRQATEQDASPSADERAS